MAKTIQIDGVGKVQVDDSFFKLSPEAQNAQVEEIVKSMGGQAASSPAPQQAPEAAAPKGPVELNPNDVWTALVNKESSNQAGVLGPMTKYGRAVGLAQTLPDTAKAMATKLGLPWRPDLLSGTSKEARHYQEMVGKAYFNEGLDKYGGDVEKALRYYNGGPNGVNLAETAPYAHSIIQAALGHPTPDTPNAPGEAPPPPSDGGVTASGDVPIDPNYDPKNDTAGEDLPQFSPDQKAQILSYLPKAKTGADLQAFARKLSGNPRLSIGNADQVVDYIRKGGDPAKLAWASPELAESPPPQPSPDANVGHVGAVATRGAGQGIADILETGANAALGQYLPRQLVQALNPASAVQKAYDTVTGSFGQPQTPLDKYIAAVPEGAVSGAVVGPEMGMLPAIRGGIGAMVGGQAASDLGLSPMLGSIIGGGLSGPDAIRDRIPGNARGRFVRRAAANPRVAHMNDVIQGYKDAAAEMRADGLAPKGRAPLDVEHINAVNDEGLKGLYDVINEADLPSAKKKQLRRAILKRSTIQLDTPDAQGDSLNALGNSPAAEAVRQAILRRQAGRALTPAFGGKPTGTIRKAGAALVKAMKFVPGNPIPAAGLEWAERAIRGSGDINNSRMDAAALAMKRQKLFQRAAGGKSSGYDEAMQRATDEMNASLNRKDALKAAKAKAAADRKAALAATSTSNDLISRRIERNIVKPTEGYRGLIYQTTGVTQPVQDQALIRMVQAGELDPKDLARVMADPGSLMRGKSKAGLKIMDRINQMADQGLIKRDPEWKGPPKSESGLPQGVAQWLDANGDPIRSMGAYAGGIVKNVVREMQQPSDFDTAIGVEKPPKPTKPKSKKKKKQGA